MHTCPILEHIADDHRLQKHIVDRHCGDNLMDRLHHLRRRKNKSVDGPSTPSTSTKKQKCRWKTKVEMDHLHHLRRRKNKSVDGPSSGSVTEKFFLTFCKHSLLNRYMNY